jgi:hypothetical protein
MNFITLLLFILAGVGITNLVVNASILDYPRDFIIERSEFFNGLLTCMMCSGFWVGMLLAIFTPGINLLYGGAIISLLSYITGSLLDYLQIITAIKSMQLEDEEIEDDR